MLSWEPLGGSRMIVGLPRVDLDDLIAAGEVALHEGLRCWTLDAGSLDLLTPLVSVFSRRAVIGVSDLRTPEQASAAHRAGAAFGLCAVTSAGLAAHRELQLALGALTPNEILAASQGRAAVLVSPSDAMGTGYARALPEMFPGLALIAAGRMERFVADIWLEAGAAAVLPTGWLRPDQLTDPDLTELRQRLQALADT